LMIIDNDLQIACLYSYHPTTPLLYDIFFFNLTAPTQLSTLSLRDALPICDEVNAEPASVSIDTVIAWDRSDTGWPAAAATASSSAMIRSTWSRPPASMIAPTGPLNRQVTTPAAAMKIHFSHRPPTTSSTTCRRKPGTSRAAATPSGTSSSPSPPMVITARPVSWCTAPSSTVPTILTN